MADVANELDLDTSDKRRLSNLLQVHPSFEKVDRRWQVGRFRADLETQPAAGSRRARC